MVQYSSRAIRGLAFLFRKYNDIDIYVEDETCKGMYEMLFERMLGERVKISRVFQLKGKENVIEMCKSDQDDILRRRIYIVDGDFDTILGKRIGTNLKYFYQLRVYCSENLIFAQDSIEEIAYESITNVLRGEASIAVDFSKLLGEIMKLVDLFALYVVAYKYKIPVQTSGYNVSRLLEIDKTRLSLELINKREEELRVKLYSDLPKNKIQDEFRIAKKKVERAPLKFISGKSYLLPFLYNYMKIKVNYTGNLNQLKIRLARYCKLNADNGLVSALRKESQRIIIFKNSSSLLKP